MSPTAPTVLDAWSFPDGTAADLAQWAPQASLFPVLDELVPAMLSADGRVDALVAVERYIAMLQARSAELLSALDEGDSTDDQFTRDSVAVALRLPPASVKARMADARDLAVRLPATLALLRAGEISQRHGAILVELTRSLPADTATTVETSVLHRAPRQTTAQFRASVRTAVLRVTDPATEAAAHVDAVTERRVVFIPGADGMTEMLAYLSADSAALIKATLDAMADKTIHLPGGDDRTADQRRADALVDLARDALNPTPVRPATACPDPAGPASADAGGSTCTGPSSGDADNGTTDADPDWGTPACTDLAPAGSDEPTATGFRLVRAHGQRPAIHVTIAASTLMGLDDQSCELEGYGPITAAMGRRIAADPTAGWRRLLTDDRGHVLHASTKSYRPTAAIVATVLARDQHCTFPGCRRPAIYNDLDHVTAWHEGDSTTAANLASVCRRHHRLKHSGIWRVGRDDTSGVMTWTDRRGRSYTSRPPDLPTTTGTPHPVSANLPAPTGDPATTDLITDKSLTYNSTTNHATDTIEAGMEPPPF